MRDYFHDNIKINKLSNSSAEKAAIDSVNIVICVYRLISLYY